MLLKVSGGAGKAAWTEGEQGRESMSASAAAHLRGGMDAAGAAECQEAHI